MGMGEPLLNLRAVTAAARFINADLGVGARRITVSTVGVPNAIGMLARALTDPPLQLTLAVSVHAPNQAVRQKIVPSAKAYPLDALLQDCQKFLEVTGRRVTFEYTLLAGVNDSPAQVGPGPRLSSCTLLQNVVTGSCVAHACAVGQNGAPAGSLHCMSYIMSRGGCMS